MVLSRSSRYVKDAEDHGRCKERRQLSWFVEPVGLGDSNGAPGRRFLWTVQDLRLLSALAPHYLAVPIAVPKVDFCGKLDAIITSASGTSHGEWTQFAVTVSFIS